MPTATLRPNATIAAFGTTSIVPSGTAHGVNSDDSDSSYLLATNEGSGVTFDLTTFTLGAGRVRTVRPRARLRSNDSTSCGVALGFTTLVGGVFDMTLTFLTSPAISTTLVTRQLAPTPVSWDQSQIDLARMEVVCLAPTSGAALRIVEAYLDVLYATQPTITITAPTGDPTITDTNRPTITWNYTQGDDGGPQARYQVKVFTQAQVAAGGFSPDTTEPIYDSGEVSSSSSSHTIAEALANTTDYEVFVRAAQTINGQLHWSDWDDEEFTVDVDTADVDTVTAVPDNDDANITITVTRDSLSEAWDVIEVQRQVDGGTWAPVRGANGVPTADANTFVAVDHETPNGADVLYRARATRIVSDLPITGAWVESATPVSWESARTWLKDPLDPTVNRIVTVFAPGSTERVGREGVFVPVGGTKPIIVADQLPAGRSAITIHCHTPAEAAAVDALLGRRTLLLQHPDNARHPHRYIQVARTIESPVGRKFPQRHHRILVEFHEIDAPGDITP